MAEPDTQTTDTPTRQPHKRRLPILVRHAISLLAVFVIAVPISYSVGRRAYRGQRLSQLDRADAQTFERGLSFVYAHAPDDPHVRDSAIARLETLDDARAIELMRVLATSFAARQVIVQTPGQPPDDFPETIIAAGADLMTRLAFSPSFELYHQLDAVGLARKPRVAKAFNGVLEVEEDARFLEAVDFYESRAIWSPAHVPEDAWLRWALILAHSDAELTQLYAAQLLGEMRSRADQPKLTQAMAFLAASKSDFVRLRVLDRCAGFAMIAKDPTPYEQIIFTLGSDHNTTIARRAWITLGLIDPLSGFAPDWRSARPEVAEAILWAAVKTNPDRPEPAIEAFDDPTMRPAAILAMSNAPANSIPIVIPTDAINAAHPWFTDTPDPLSVWRGVIAFDPWSYGDPESWGVNLWDLGWQQQREAPGEQSLFMDDEFTSVFLAITYRFNEVYPPNSQKFLQDRQPHLELAAIEGAAYARSPHYASNPLVPPTDPFAQLCGAALDVYEPDLEPLAKQVSIAPSAATSATRDLLTFAYRNGRFPNAANLKQQLTGAQGQSLILAAAMRGEHFTLLSGVTADFLQNHDGLTTDQLHAMSDAQLAQLGLKRVDALTTLFEIAEHAVDRHSRNEEIAMLKLALWMRGDLGDEFTPQSQAMLYDEELPTSTVLMCLLHMKRPAALEFLFAGSSSPLDTPGANINLPELMIAQRWWHVFKQLVPDPDLDLWLWGDPDAQAFQFEVMRQWYHLNRWRFEDGWWPGDD